MLFRLNDHKPHRHTPEFSGNPFWQSVIAARWDQIWHETFTKHTRGVHKLSARQCNFIPANHLECIPPLLREFHDSMVSSPSRHMCSHRFLPKTNKLDFYHRKQPQMLTRSVRQNWSLTGAGFFRRLKTLVSPRLREAMVGWGPNDSSLSLCQAILSFPSRYRLHSTELKVCEISRSIVWRRFRMTGCHCGTKEKKKLARYV